MRPLLLVLALLGPIERLDETVQLEVQRSRQPVLERPMKALSGLGRSDLVLGTLLAIALLDGAAGVETARLAIVTLVPVNLIVEGLKRATGRTRPDGERKRSNSSFPSSHSANAVALAALFARRWRRLAPAFWIGAAGVACSRLYLNRHFLSDVVVGAAIGFACAWAVTQWRGRRGWRGRSRLC